MICMMSFLRVGLGEPVGVVVVQAPVGVAPELWTPVFMYASLS